MNLPGPGWQEMTVPVQSWEQRRQAAEYHIFLILNAHLKKTVFDRAISRKKKMQ